MNKLEEETTSQRYVDSILKREANAPVVKIDQSHNNIDMHDFAKAALLVLLVLGSAPVIASIYGWDAVVLLGGSMAIYLAGMMVILAAICMFVQLYNQHPRIGKALVALLAITFIYTVIKNGGGSSQSYEEYDYSEHYSRE